ncbi:MAG TPA: hypothetical protein VH593_25430 [Ktedonobacteraceae bacterium]|jgi:hypothetical protein
MCLWRKRAVTPFERWKAVLKDDVQALSRETKDDEEGRIRFILKEQTLGQHCCEAEEYLSDAELRLLKQELGLTDHQWHTYKANVLPKPF